MNLSGTTGFTITAVLPAYNAAAFITETLAAVAGERRPPDEIVVVDDGSSDETVAVVRRWADANRPDLKLITQSNQGPSAARNTGIRAATSELIATIDADDVVLPNHLELLESGFVMCPDLDLCFGDAESFDGNIICRPSFLRGSAVCRLPHETIACGLHVIQGSAYCGIVGGSRIPTSATLYRRQTALDAGLYNVSFPRCNDREFLLRMSRRAVFGYFSVVVERIRRHETNLTHRRHHAAHLEQQIRALKSMLGQQELLLLNAEEIRETKRALQRAVNQLCRAKASGGVRSYLRYLMRAASRRELPSLYATSRNFVRSVYHGMPTNKTADPIDR